MQFLINDLSLCGQFINDGDFHDAINRIMLIRGEIAKTGIALHCHRKLSRAKVSRDTSMLEAAACLSHEKRRALMQWLTSHGPYWEDEQAHDSGEWYEANGDVVTDTGLAESAALCRRGTHSEVVSFHPSPWLRTPIAVSWERFPNEVIQITNHWDIQTVRASIAHHAPAIIDSWAALESHCRKEYSELTFGIEAFRPLDGHPFVPGACERLIYLLQVLNQFKLCFDTNGDRTAAGDELYKLHFAGGKALFTDSSATEKNDFRSALTFSHPSERGHLFCTWHGKVKTPQLRIHFTYPILKTVPLYIMYIGPKITKY